ncbi:MAG: RnfABCDGE type electron transport complex subunit D [Ruminococcus flavefaciens]|nr:RnfABCDGE type electron transport complex subunit D [Ruminococcus flavefaciens]MCM1231635.1 RnfABCDGE type electron transport complex subunit D [Ruminococcus flavefaciens]
MQKKVKSERFIWLDVMLTLITLEIMQFFYYGIRSVALVGVCIGVSLVAEIVSVRLMKRHFTADDLTCISDALIISLMMPAVMNFRIAGIACVFAVVVAKNVFGGRKNMIFSPPAVAYVFMLTSWRGQLLMYTEPHVHTGVFEKAGNLVSSASHTFNISGKMNFTDFEILMGNATGSLSILLLAVSAVILLLRRDISAGAFIGTISGTVLLACLVPMCSDVYDSVKYTLSTNMVLFSAIYIISDKRTAPKRNYYAFFYGFFIAVLSYILVLTTTKENMIVIVSLLFTPVALGFRNLEKHIDSLRTEEKKEETAVG